MLILKRFFAVIGIGVIPAFSAFADLKLEVPNGVEMYVVNQQDINDLAGDRRVLQLPNGENQIVFRFQKIFRERQYEGRVASQVMIVRFQAQDSTVHFLLPDVKTPYDLTNLDPQQDWQLQKETKQIIPMHVDLLVHEGIQFSRDYVAETVAYNKTHAPASLNTNAATKAKPLAAQD